MTTKTRSIDSLTGPFVSTAACTGARPPLRLLGADARGWKVAERSGDVVVLDEFGDLWWARLAAPGCAQVIRTCWPEEARSLRDAIASAMAGL